MKAESLAYSGMAALLSFSACNSSLSSQQITSKAPPTPEASQSTVRPSRTSSPVGLSEDEYITSKGAVFLRTTKPGKFGKAWKDPKGIIWSGPQGSFSYAAGANEINPPAVQACLKIGGVLPDLEDYGMLSPCFDFDSPQGKKDLETIFPGTPYVWTSTYVPDWSSSAYAVFLDSFIGTYEKLDRHLEVLCVDYSNFSRSIKTSTGAVFTEIMGPVGFGKAWKAPNGTFWSTDQGNYSNEPIKPDANGMVSETPATKACAKIGGLLPTVKNFNELISYFDLDASRKLSERGKKDFSAIFPTMAAADFIWTASLNPPGDPQQTPGSDNASVFLSDGSISTEGMPRTLDVAHVFCVSREQ